MPNYLLNVSELITLSPTAKAIRINLENKPFQFQPGQFIMMEMDLESTGKFKVSGDKKRIQKRPFSMSSSPLSQDYLEVTVKTTESAFVSDYLVNYLTEGEKIAITGPFGKFFFNEAETRPNIMMIGAGSGISPLMSILRHIRGKKLHLKTHLLYSNKTENEILWRDEIESLSENENSTHEFTLTQEDWQGTQGRINKDMISNSSFLLKETDFYLCGPPEFVKATENMILEELKVPKENIKKEVYD
jgi:glycine betaine catabolism B